MVVALEALGAVTACIAHQSFTARVLLELESIEKKVVVHETTKRVTSPLLTSSRRKKTSRNHV
jgi:hypothetical protein